jgi:hypothetical protein
MSGITYNDEVTGQAVSGLSSVRKGVALQIEEQQGRRLE